MIDPMTGRVTGSPAVELSLVLERFEAALPRLVAAPMRPWLVRARFADALRSRMLMPLPPAELEALTSGLDAEAWGRLSLLADALELRELLDEIVILSRVMHVRELAEHAFAGLARDLDLLTLELLSRSAHRREELARVWLLRLGIQVEGESEAESSERLERLDYARLMNDVERARANSESRAGFLKELQLKADALTRRRGKW